MFKKNYQATFSQVTASEDTHRRIMNMTNTKKHRRSRGLISKALLAAAIVTMLAATASAAGFGWFTRFFGGPENLNQDQIQYLEENTQTLPVSSSDQANAVHENGYGICVNSIIIDGASAFVALDITVPEHMKSPGEGWVMEDGLLISNFWLCPADQQKPTREEVIRWSWSSRTFDDGDGKDNTCTLVLSATRNGTEILSDLGKEWTLHIGGLEAAWYNAEKEAQVKGEYAGQDYLVDGEEVTQYLRYETLCDDTWEFALNLDVGQSDDVEFVAQPISISGYRHATLEELRQDPDNDRIGPFTVQLVSLRISPLSYYVQYAAEDAFNAQTVDVGAHTLVMKDGTEIALTQYNGRHTFDEPIMMSEIDHIRLSNGTILTVAK